ncbi:MAG: hypothetical protein Q3999_05245 [Buchananella hordeovulneris]|nr:hypothetical protein [Buchananella hordeovulneris]
MFKPKEPVAAYIPNYYRWLVADTSLALGSSFRSFALPALVFLATGSESQAGVIQATAVAVSGATLLVGGFYMLLIPKQMLGRVWAAVGVSNAVIAPLVSLGLGYSLEHWGPTATGLLLALGMAPPTLFTLTSRQILAIPGPDGWEDFIKANRITPTAIA